jgi:A/G-specific adenine glycosylase
VSETMSQQTQVHRVVPKWQEFLQRWPTVDACAAASLGDILRVWQGLGYPRRAKNLHACAVVIAERGTFPSTLAELQALPGIGPYTARAVLAFAFEEDVAVVDTNTARVLARWNNQQLKRVEVQTAADAALPLGYSWAWNQAMLDLGALVCTLRSPSCAVCPVISMCAYKGVGEDPARGTAAVSVPQATFAGSDRQLRGRLLRRAAAGFQLAEAASAVDAPDQPHRVRLLIEALITEGLLAHTAGQIHLPD